MRIKLDENLPVSLVAVLAALGAVTFDGPRGLVQMSASRHAALAMRLARVQADGSARILQTFGNTDPGAQCPGF